MPSFENPEIIHPVSEKGEEKIKEGGEEMEIRKQEVNEQGWKEAIDKTIGFHRKNFLNFDIFKGRIVENELREEKLKEFQRLQDILGKNVVEYIGSKETGSISGALPEELIKKEEAARLKEYERIRGLTPEELAQEAEQYAAEVRKEDEELEKMEEEAKKDDPLYYNPFLHRGEKDY